MSKIEFRKKDDPTIVLPYNTRDCEVIELVPQKIKKSFWDATNNRRSIPEIDAFGYEVLYTPSKTAEELAWDKYIPLYAACPTLADRVQTYYDFMIQLNLDTTIMLTSDDISLGISQLNELSHDEQTELGMRIQTCFHDILVNMQAMGVMSPLEVDGDDFAVWSSLPMMFLLLPSRNPVEPERTVPIIVTPEIEGDLLNDGVPL